MGAYYEETKIRLCLSFDLLSFSTNNMKTRTTIYTKTIWPSLAIILMAGALIASAQSGRVVPTPPTPTPTPPATLPQKSAAKRGLVTLGSGDTYKLVFPAAFDGKRFYRMDKERKELALADLSELKGFIEQLNKAGEQGYKLMSVINRGFPVGLAKFDENQYEYAGFDTTTNLFFGLGGFEQIYAGWSRQGFHLTDHFLISSYCEYVDPDNSALGQNCEYVHRFLLEREQGDEKPRPHVIAGSSPGWRAKPSVELSNRVNQALAKGFYPAHVLSKFEILLEQTMEGDERVTDKSEVQVIESSGRDNMMKKINELARQGYRLALTGAGVAVMYRHSEAATPITYVWLKTQDKSFEKQLAKLQESGAVYRMIYPDIDGEESGLVFEQNPINAGPQREYKVLKLKFDFVENGSEKKVHISLAPQSKETMKKLNELVKERYTVRDLFVSDEVSVLLERTR